MKKKLILKVETVRQMQTSQLSQVVGGTLYFTGYASCTCVYVNTAIVGGLKSIDGRCGLPTGGYNGGDPAY